MSRSDAGPSVGTSPPAVITPPLAQAARVSQPRWRMLAAVAGIVGPLLLVAYFIIPLFIHWPAATESPARLTAYASAHKTLFYFGGWLQVTGALLSVAFLLVLLQLSRARATLAGAVTLVGCAVLLATVGVEAAMLSAVPMAAANGDPGTVATTFLLGNGVFVRIYGLAPAPLVFAGIGLALAGSTILPRFFARSALVIAGLFLIAGLAAVFSTGGLIAAIVMSVVEAIWIPAAAIAFLRSTARSRA